MLQKRGPWDAKDWTTEVTLASADANLCVPLKTLWTPVWPLWSPPSSVAIICSLNQRPPLSLRIQLCHACKIDPTVHGQIAPSTGYRPKPWSTNWNLHERCVSVALDNGPGHFLFVDESNELPRVDCHGVPKLWLYTHQSFSHYQQIGRRNSPPGFKHGPKEPSQGFWEESIKKHEKYIRLLLNYIS